MSFPYPVETIRPRKLAYCTREQQLAWLAACDSVETIVAAATGGTAESEFLEKGALWRRAGDGAEILRVIVAEQGMVAILVRSALLSAPAARRLHAIIGLGYVSAPPSALLKADGDSFLWQAVLPAVGCADPATMPGIRGTEISAGACDPESLLRLRLATTPEHAAELAVTLGEAARGVFGPPGDDPADGGDEPDATSDIVPEEGGEPIFFTRVNVGTSEDPEADSALFDSLEDAVVRGAAMIRVEMLGPNLRIRALLAEAMVNVATPPRAMHKRAYAALLRMAGIGGGDDASRVLHGRLLAPTREGPVEWSVTEVPTEAGSLIRLERLASPVAVVAPGDQEAAAPTPEARDRRLVALIALAREMIRAPIPAREEEA